jgi:hypothetical protein
MRSIRIQRRRGLDKPLKPRGSWVDSRVVIMDAKGNVLRRVEPHVFAPKPKQDDES